jgi:hypothetical protein
MHNCKRCGNEVSWTSDSTDLYGGVKAHLCNDCVTEWDQHLYSSDVGPMITECDTLENHYRSLALAQSPVSQDEWRKFIELERACQKAAHAVGVAFIQSLPEWLEKRQASRDALLRAMASKPEE